MSLTRRDVLAGAAAVGGTLLWQSEASAQAQGGQSPSRQQIDDIYTKRRNWGRWGADDQRGAVNLITAEKRVAATRLVSRGRSISLSRPFQPEQQFTRITNEAAGGSVIDYYGFIYHGTTVTHIDALGHVWDHDGMWNGRKPSEVLDTQGAHFGDIAAFSDGLVTRGVLLDVPRHRGQPHVTVERPVQGAELAAIAAAQKVSVTAGDALLVYSGREAFQRGGGSYGSADRPGLHPTCAGFIRDHDVAILGWDMMDARPDGYGLRWPVHGVLFNYGVVLLDNALLEPLAAACAEEKRYEFLFVALPLRVPRGTGSPANPVAIF